MTPDVNTFLTLLLGTGVDDPTAVRALAIGYAESGGRTDAVSPPNSNGTIDYGFMQINSAHFGEPAFKSHGWNQQTMLQIGPNIDAANYLSAGWKNWAPWSTFNSGAYMSHVAQATADVQAWKVSKGNPAAVVGGAVSSAIGGPMQAVQAALTGAVTWLNKFAATAGIAILGILMIAAGVALFLRKEVVGAATTAGKAAILA